MLIIGREDDKEWPQPDKVGRQELEIVLGNEHISFTVRMRFTNNCADFEIRLIQRSKE